MTNTTHKLYYQSKGKNEVMVQYNIIEGKDSTEIDTFDVSEHGLWRFLTSDNLPLDKAREKYKEALNDGFIELHSQREDVEGARASWNMRKEIDRMEIS